MKTFIVAFALVAGFPAIGHAQSAPGHDHHKGMDHGKADKDCCDHRTADDKKMACCEKAGGQEGKKACCEKHEQKNLHSGHAMNH